MPLFDDSRAAWGAAASTNPRRIAPGARVGVSWHYPGGFLKLTPASPHTSCLSQVRAWQRAHQAKGWADIGYNLLICQHARVVEGRGVDLQGSHSPGVNATHYGVQFMTSNEDAPTPAMYARAVTLRAALEAHSGKTLRQWGHRDDPQASTACPGDTIEAWVKAGGPRKTSSTSTAPKPTPTPAPVKEPDMQLSDTIPGTNPALTVAQALIRGAWAYAQIVEGGSIDRRIDAATAALSSLRAALEAKDVDAAKAILDRIQVDLTVKPEAPA